MSSVNGSTGINCFFQHGWGFDSTCWKAMLPDVKGLRCFFSDRGYFRSSKQEGVMISAGGLKLLVCHSFGLHLVDKVLFDECRVLVLISCFQSFHGEDDKAGGFSRKHVRRMFLDLEKSPRSLLEKFHLNCGSCFSVPDQVEINQELLFEDLKMLDSSIFDLRKLSRIPKILLLHGLEDRIVPVQRSRHIASMFNNSTLIEVPDAGHCLPFTNPDIVWKTIRDAVAL